MVIIASVTIVVSVDFMLIDGNAPVHAATDPLANGVVSPPVPTTETGATCGTKMRLRLESAATECELADCGMASIRTLVPSTTPHRAVRAGRPITLLAPR